MELQAYWRILIRRWWLVVLPVAAVLIHTAAIYRQPAPVYQVVMRFAAGTEPAGLSEDYDRYYPWLTSEYVANGLADVAGSGAFAQAVATRLAQGGVSIDGAAIQGAIVTDNLQSIMVVYLTWPDPTQARAVATAIADELTQNGATYFPQLQGLDPAARLLDEPAPFPLAPSLRSQLIGPAIRLGLALALGVGLAFAWHYVDPTVREAAELEQLGIGVIATIPRR
ncbi:MAG: hypothetical protein JW900_02870 [Anaerolineae bacterium]|nr:hypothetical protein [Anaerolineae bacterium]